MTYALSDFLGVTVVAAHATHDTLALSFDDGRILEFYHSQDCCEHVSIEDITGDLDDLVGEPLLLIEESTNVDHDNAEGTWTFYKFASRRGYVDVRWLGVSNGYYSERVDWTVRNIIDVIKKS